MINIILGQTGGGDPVIDAIEAILEHAGWLTPEPRRPFCQHTGSEPQRQPQKALCGNGSSNMRLHFLELTDLNPCPPVANKVLCALQARATPRNPLWNREPWFATQRVFFRRFRSHVDAMWSRANLSLSVNAWGAPGSLSRGGCNNFGPSCIYPVVATVALQLIVSVHAANNICAFLAPDHVVATESNYRIRPIARLSVARGSGIRSGSDDGSALPHLSRGVVRVAAPVLS